MLLKQKIKTMTVFALLGLAVNASAHETHWDYKGSLGPAHWGQLEGDAACATGTLQSPINITGVKAAEQQPVVQFDYKDSPFNVVNNGHTVQVNFAEGSSITIDGKQYKLLQFHFHTPSEDAINGKRHSMEAHFVHKSEDGKLAVIGVLLDKATTGSQAFATVMDRMPTEPGEERSYSNITINPASFMPANKSYYFFSGSLTTPPCSEGVKWLVMKEGVKVGTKEINAFHHIYKMNARPLQPVNNREIVQSQM